MESDDKLVSIEKTRTRLQACITRTKSHKGQKFLSEAQIHCNFPCQRLLTPVKTRFAYLIVAFRCLLKNRAAIDYLYGEKPGMSNSLREENLRGRIGSVVLSQARTDKWLLSDAMDNLITVYIDCLKVLRQLTKQLLNKCVSIKIKHEYSEDSCIFARNLEEMSKKMCFAVKQKIKNILSRFWT